MGRVIYPIEPLLHSREEGKHILFGLDPGSVEANGESFMEMNGLSSQGLVSVTT